MPAHTTTLSEPPLSADLLHGADEISRFVYGEPPNEKTAESNRRKIYHASVKHGLPTFKLGGAMTARRSTILKWIECQEPSGHSQS